MTIDRALKKVICFALIGALLFSQMAVAGYACPTAVGMKPMAHGHSVAATVPAGSRVEGLKSGSMNPDCGEVDRDAINLCVEQCNFGDRSVGSAAAPLVPAPILAVLYFLPLQPEHASGLARAVRPYDAMLAASPPPHTILHCVFLI